MLTIPNNLAIADALAYVVATVNRGKGSIGASIATPSPAIPMH